MFCGNATHRRAGDISLRQVKRITAAYRKEGVAALAHGNGGGKPHNALDDGVKRRVLELVPVTHAGCNTRHFIPTSLGFW
jgi:hypothetical protein